jgi:histidine decarboxylase
LTPDFSDVTDEGVAGESTAGRPGPLWTEPEPESAVAQELAALERRLRAARPTNLGFPGAVDFDYDPLKSFFGQYLLNNVGDPVVEGAGHNHTKHMELEVISTLGDLLRAPRNDRWGYVTGGGSEGNLYALYLARTLYPGGIVYYSSAAHYSVDKAIHLLGMPSCRIKADHLGRLDYADLAAHVRANAARPAIVVATIGTTMTEAVDDVRVISDLLRRYQVTDRFIHADAALAGIPLALLEPDRRPGMDFEDGADSIAVSGHKFIGSPFPSGVVLVRAHHRARVAKDVEYISSPDSTISGSRSGHAPLLLWYALRTLRVEGLRQRAQECRQLAEYTVGRIRQAGWEAYRHDHAFTVVIRTPPEQVTKKWVLAASKGWSHIICMPGVTQDQIDSFVTDLAAAVTVPRAVRSEPRPSESRALTNETRAPGERAGSGDRVATAEHRVPAPRRPLMAERNPFAGNAQASA